MSAFRKVEHETGGVLSGIGTGLNYWSALGEPGHAGSIIAAGLAVAAPETAGSTLVVAAYLEVSFTAAQAGSIFFSNVGDYLQKQ